MARALHAALLRRGVKAGDVFEGEEWEDRVIVATKMSHEQTIRSYTKAGRAQRLWTVESGGGRGNKRRVTILPGPQDQVTAEAATATA